MTRVLAGAEKNRRSAVRPNVLSKTLQITQKFLRRSVDQWWYAPAIGILSALDLFLFFIPNDGIMISSILVMPRRWFIFGLSIALGSVLGGWVLMLLVQSHGLPWLLNLFPGIQTSSTWAWTEKFFSQYGLWMVFATAASPMIQQPALILALLAKASASSILAVYGTGRVIKSMILAYLASHAPHVIGKLWGMKGQLKAADISQSADQRPKTPNP